MTEVIDIKAERLPAAAEFRLQVAELVQRILEHEGAKSGDQIAQEYEHTHEFAGDLYIRTVEVPAGELCVTKIHLEDHPFFIQRGRVTILTEDGPAEVEAPYRGITKAGCQRVGYVHEDVSWTTVHHVGDKRDVQDIEDSVTSMQPLDAELLEREILALGGLT